MGLTVPPPPKMRHPDSVTCAYCGRRRDASAHECPSCGAQQVADAVELIEVTSMADERPRFMAVPPRPKPRMEVETA